MKIRLGFVAMSVQLKKASPSQTMTVTNFQKLADREAGLRRLTRIAASNLENTLRLLRHALAHDIKVYRFTSKLVPLLGHELTAEWDFWSKLRADFAAVGQFVKMNGMRVSFHPDHYTLLNSTKPEVFRNSVADLERHVQMFELMGLDERAKLVMHVGAGYKNKQESLERFARQWTEVPEQVKRRITLENDDKTFTAEETLTLCERLDLPMVLDIHHHRCNPCPTPLVELLPRIFQRWEGTGLVPKIHVSSPKSMTDMRSHADYINPFDLVPFLDQVQELGDQDLDIMVEAKQKDAAAMRLADELAALPGMIRLDGGSLEYRPG